MSARRSTLAPPPNKIRRDVAVTSSPQLDFQNSYAKLAGTVDLTVRGSVAGGAIRGRIQITDGSATFAGTKYELQRGDIYFSNPVRIDPAIDINATARVETYDITVGLHGTMSNCGRPIALSLRSARPTSSLCSRSVAPRKKRSSIRNSRCRKGESCGTTSALLGGALNATVSNRIGKLFGGGTEKIDPAFVGTLGNSTARITVQKQITRQADRDLRDQRQFHRRTSAARAI